MVATIITADGDCKTDLIGIDRIDCFDFYSESVFVLNIFNCNLCNMLITQVVHYISLSNHFYDCVRKDKYVLRASKFCLEATLYFLPVMLVFSRYTWTFSIIEHQDKFLNLLGIVIYCSFWLLCTFWVLVTCLHISSLTFIH